MNAPTQCPFLPHSYIRHAVDGRWLKPDPAKACALDGGSAVSGHALPLVRPLKDFGAAAAGRQSATSHSPARGAAAGGVGGRGTRGGGLRRHAQGRCTGSAGEQQVCVYVCVVCVYECIFVCVRVLVLSIIHMSLDGL